MSGGFNCVIDQSNSVIEFIAYEQLSLWVRNYTRKRNCRTIAFDSVKANGKCIVKVLRQSSAFGMTASPKFLGNSDKDIFVPNEIRQNVDIDAMIGESTAVKRMVH